MDAVFARLYPILEDMLEAARREDQTEVFEIHRQFGRVLDPSYSREDFPERRLLVQYDACANACVGHVAVQESMRQAYPISVAEQRFSELPKPE